MTTATVDLLTRDEVLEQLKIGRSTLYSWMEGEGVSPNFPLPVKIGSLNRWVPSEIAEWVALQPRASIGG